MRGLVAFHPPGPVRPGTKGEPMADHSALGGLLDRAGNVFSLAGQLGLAFHQERETQGRVRQIDPTGWDRHQPAFNEFCAAVLDLRDAMQNPPDGFAPVANALRKAAGVAKQIRDAMQTAHGRTEAVYLDFFPELNTVAADGREAIRDVTKARQPDDPFAFVDQSTMGKDAGIDTTPTLPKPPPALIASAARGIPGILANVQPKHDGAIELVASHLAKRLQDAKHTLAAAQWAIHEGIQTGRLRIGLVEVEMSSFLPRGCDVWQGGERGTIAIPEGKPAPFDAFKVTATDSLWTWWRSFDAADSQKARRIAQPFGNTPMVDAELPSPFTIPEPTFRFAEGPPSEPRPVRSMTVGGLIHNLTIFADFYERASADIDRAEPLLKPAAVGNRDANADHMRRDLRATVAIDRVRAYVLAKYGADLTIGTARRLLGDLIRICALTVDAAEALPLEAAMDRLDAAETRKDESPADAAHDEPALAVGRTPAELTPAKPTDHSSVALLSVFTNGIADDRIKEASRLLSDDVLTANEKLTKIDALIRFPATASAEQLGELLGVTKQAVLKTDWWIRNRKGEKDNEIGRRRAGHQKRAKEHETHEPRDDDQ